MPQDPRILQRRVSRLEGDFSALKADFERRAKAIAEDLDEVKEGVEELLDDDDE